MISLIIQDFNTLDQIISSKDLQAHYYKVISQYDYLSFNCNKCGENNWHIHGSYKRKLILFGYTYEIDVIRIKCAHCGTTHVLLPAFIIPFNLISIKDLLSSFKPKIKDIKQIIISKARKLSLVFLYPT